MGRKMIAFWTILGMACAVAWMLLFLGNALANQETICTVLDVYQSQLEVMEEGERLLQWNLARWYGRNLTTDHPDPGFRAAYDKILAFEDGVLGILILGDEMLPIYHQGALQSIPGAEHRAASAFPLGTRESCCLLRLPDGWDAGAMDARSVLKIRCLDRTTLYRPVQTEDQPDTAEAVLGLILENRTIWCTRCTQITLPQAPKEDPKLPVLAVGAAAVFLLLPLILCAADRGYHRKKRQKTEKQRVFPEKYGCKNYTHDV